MNKGYDVIVIGAGIIGLSCAYYLSKAGKKVLVLEKNEIGSGASGSCDEVILLQSKKPGILLMMAFESLELYEGLSCELGMNLEFSREGGMIFIETPEQMKIMEDFVSRQSSYGLKVDIMDRNELRKKQPHVKEGVIASTYSHLDACVNPFKVMFGFARKGVELGMHIKKNAEVISIDKAGNDNWVVKTLEGNSYEGEVVINAAGAWAPVIGRMVDIHLPIKPKRGQVVVTEQIPRIGETNAWSAEYIVSKLDPAAARNRDKVKAELGMGFSFSYTKAGNYLIGSTREFVGYNKNTTHRALEMIVSQAVDFFPVLKDVNIIRSYAGLRPACDDGRPIIGEVAALPGFFVAAGHEGDGIALAPVTGRIISRLVCGKNVMFNLEELSPQRLTGRGD